MEFVCFISILLLMNISRAFLRYKRVVVIPDTYRLMLYMVPFYREHLLKIFRRCKTLFTRTFFSRAYVFENCVAHAWVMQVPGGRGQLHMDLMFKRMSAACL
ncbi:unnamed protein product [Meganyctiphanes norvegica]|uniref:Secreted protein n=1 Tax=Meganyctiphanes norvegica TaxID=48144 RepID=A0AAV2RVB1_MEGNR